jgi:hypothetical protein
VEGGNVAIPVDAVGQIVEYEVAPLPLARGGVRGLGLIDGKLVVSVGPGRGRPREGRRHVKGVILRTANSTEHWAFEVLEVLSFIEVTTPEKRGGACVVAGENRELVWLDVEEMVQTANVPIMTGAAE